MAPLKHKVIVLTGGVAAGKTTVKKAPLTLLESLGRRYFEVNSVRDLYVPFGQEKGLLPIKPAYTRTEITQLVKRVYKRYGKEQSTELLKKFLTKNNDQDVYIVDSKRNPEGINALKKTIEGVVVIGVQADFHERIMRYKERKKEMDKRARAPAAVFKHEENLFSISTSVTQSDLIVENHVQLPEVLPVKLYQLLRTRSFITGDSNGKSIKPPQQKYVSKKLPLLPAGRISRLIGQAIAAEPSSFWFIIQGGSRYAARCFKRCGVKTESIKLLCLSKAPLDKVFNSLLKPEERVSALNKEARRSLVKAFKELPKKIRQHISRDARRLSFKTIPELVRYGARSEVLKAFAHSYFPTPFSYPADDRRIKQEFKILDTFLAEAIAACPVKECLQIIMHDSSFNVIHQNHAVNYFDDVFYRGRTYYTIAAILKLAGIPQTGKLYTLCADRVSSSIINDAIVVLQKGLLYPFENSITTEQGYWDDEGDHFAFRDLTDYTNYHQAIQIKPVQRELQRYKKLLLTLDRNIPGSLEKEQRLHLIELMIFCRYHRLSFDLNGLLDQRAVKLGFCLPFVKIVASFIAQEAPRWQRQKYKNRIKEYYQSIEKWCATKQGKNLVKEILQQYKNTYEPYR